MSAYQIPAVHPKPKPVPSAADMVAVAADADSGIAAGDLQSVLAALAARVTALEDAA